MTIHVLDCEVNPNYFLCAVLEPVSGVVKRWERWDDVERGDESRVALRQLLERNTSVGFNSEAYDYWVIAAYLSGYSNRQIYELSVYIIEERAMPWEITAEFDLESLYWRHIDVMPVAPGMASLKAYAARLHAPTIQDLPVNPHAYITPEIREGYLAYCVNDLGCTWRLFESLRQEIYLRRDMSKAYGLKLMSKGDAQIAEGVMRKELERIGVIARPRTLKVRRSYRYNPPDYLKFSEPAFRTLFDDACTTDFPVVDSGKIRIEGGLRQVVGFRGRTYKFGIGGIHSQETAQTIVPAPGEQLFDMDIASMYPSMILVNGWYPSTVGPAFTEVYRRIVDQRLHAKATGDTVTNESLKIVINSIFGKFGNRYSAFYDPKLLLQTTVTGQLSLLMLIEWIEQDTPARVVSANTDGVIVHAPSTAAMDHVLQLAAEWQTRTGLMLEETHYERIIQKDVNNYVAITRDGKYKRKGIFAADGLRKNPAFPIVAQATVDYLVDGVVPEQTLTDCTDIRQFVASKKVAGGAVHAGRPCGKTVRWYQGYLGEPIHYATNGNKVGLSDQAELAQRLPDVFPADLDHGWYLDRVTWTVERTGNRP